MRHRIEQAFGVRWTSLLLSAIALTACSSSHHASPSVAANVASLAPAANLCNSHDRAVYGIVRATPPWSRYSGKAAARSATFGCDATIDPDGHFTLHVPRGDYTISAYIGSLFHGPQYPCVPKGITFTEPSKAAAPLRFACPVPPP